MKKIVIAYLEWLEALNYESKNAKTGTRKVQDFLNYLLKKDIQEIEQIKPGQIRNYFNELSQRISKITGKALSTNTLKTYQRELRRFSRYLLETDQGHLEINPQNENYEQNQTEKIIFTSEEIKKLYAACGDDELGIRDRAMLSVYYGCGLRRTEGINLEIKDVQFTRGILHVRKGKNYKERYVPMASGVITDLMEYSLLSRTKLSNDKSGNSFFVSYRGYALGAESMSTRFNKLKAAAGIEKSGSLHSLRHSIATHLLQKGMSLEQIAKFLGHSCLESTQIYTHLSSEALAKEDYPPA